MCKETQSRVISFYRTFAVHLPIPYAPCFKAGLFLFGASEYLFHSNLLNAQSL